MKLFTLMHDSSRSFLSFFGPFVRSVIMAPCVLLLGLLAFSSCKKAAKKSPVVLVTYLQGSATAVSASQKRLLRTGDPIRATDIIKTGSDSILDLGSSDGVSVRLLGNSELTAKTLLAQNMHLDVSDGNILVKVARLDSERSLEVETPTAVASVRGTQFWGQVKKADASGVFAVREGSIEIRLKKGEKKVVLAVGEAAEIAPGGTDLNKRKALPAEMGAMQQIDAIHDYASVSPSGE